MSSTEKTLYDEIQEIRARYPVSRSATLPALRLAQERHGWLSPEAFREVAEALDETPAYCMAVASFYDMYHLKPVGKKAPPRPRSPESRISWTTAAGSICRAFSSASNPPASR